MIAVIKIAEDGSFKNPTWAVLSFLWADHMGWKIRCVWMRLPIFKRIRCYDITRMTHAQVHWCYLTLWFSSQEGWLKIPFSPQIQWLSVDGKHCPIL
jgi:hypothetical protein